MNAPNLAHPPRFVPRPQMPQIGRNDAPRLLAWLASMNCPAERVQLPATRLHFRQHVSRERIANMPAWAYASPIWVSREGDVLDGNHRAAAHQQRGDPVDCYRLPVPFAEALRLLFTFPLIGYGAAL